MLNVIFSRISPLPCLIYQSNIPGFIVYWSFQGELQLLLEGCKHIREIIPSGYYGEGATCKMLMLLLKSQVESAFKKLDIRYIRYNLQCVIILMCVQLCVALHVAYLRSPPPLGICHHLKWLLSRKFLKSALKKILLINIRVKGLHGLCSHARMNGWV